MEIAEVSRCIYASDEGVQLDEGVRSREKKAFAVQMYMNNVGGRKVDKIFVRSKSLAGIEMNKSGIQGYEEIAEEGRKKKYGDVWHKDGIC
jgi:hypothetical protein